MAFSTQFALSVELSRIVPVSSIASLANNALLALVRDFKSSGSDFITELDLAVVFGRCLISPELGRSFRSRVKSTPTRSLAGIAELILQGGGPSITYGIDKPEYFPMLVQVSLLAHVHEASSLATSLAKALELRSTENPRNVPRYDALHSTLLALKEQTANFPWDGLLYAIEHEFAEFNPPEYGVQRPMSRQIPHVVLASLLDAFVAVQRLPEAHYLEITIDSGLPTLAVWAHHVLGLTIQIAAKGITRRLGPGIPTVYITKVPDYSRESEVAMYNETKDNLFKVRENAHDDPILEPSSRHTLEGLGYACLMENANWSMDIEKEAKHIAWEAIYRCVTTTAQIQDQADRLDSFAYQVPTEEQILRTALILFPTFDISQEAFNEYTSLAPQQDLALYVRPIAILISAFTIVHNLDEARTALFDLSAFVKARGQAQHRLNSWQLSLGYVDAFQVLATLLTGDIHVPSQEAVVVSNGGWSLSLSSISTGDPGMMTAKLRLEPGVPTRNQERRHLVLDTPTDVFTRTEKLELSDTLYDVTSFPGSRVALQAYLPYERQKHMVATTDKAFKIFTTYEVFSSSDASTAFRVGFRYMQDSFWGVSEIPIKECLHGFSLSREYTLPENTWAFRGFFDRVSNPDLIGTLNIFDTWATTGEYWRKPENTLYGIKPDKAKAKDKSDNAQAQANVTGQGFESHQDASNASEQFLPINRTSKGAGMFDPGTYIHVSLSAENRALRWLILLNAQNLTRHQRDAPKSLSGAANPTAPSRFDAIFIRPGLVCLDCAVKYIKDLNAQGCVHVLLIT